MRILRPASFVGALAALVFGAGFASPAVADTVPTVVNIGFCGFEGGTATVPAGSVVITQGWNVGTKGALVHWRKSQQTTVDSKEPWPGITLSTGQNDVLVEVLVGHKRKWQELVTFPLEGKHIEIGNYLAYSNTALRPIS
jgi:hypothetical protein